MIHQIHTKMIIFILEIYRMLASRMGGNVQMTDIKLLEKSVSANTVHALESMTKASQKTHTIQMRISCSLKM